MSDSISDRSSLNARRQFLKFLSASPYVASVGGIAALDRKSTRLNSSH